MSTVIAIANQKGGVGKTTTTIELGSYFHSEGRRVLLIDMDQQTNLSMYSGADNSEENIYSVLLEARKTLFSMSDNNEDIEKAVEKVRAVVRSAIQHLEWYDIIVSSDRLSNADVDFGGQDDAQLLSMVCSVVADDYDYILIDNSPARSTLMNMSYTASDFMIIPTEADEGSLKGIQDLYKDIKRKRDVYHSSHTKIEAILLTKYEGTSIQAAAHQRIIEDLITPMEDRPLLCTIRKNTSVTATKLAAEPLQVYKSYDNAAIDYRRAGEAILERLERRPAV